MSTALHVLDTINSPADVKKLSVEEMKQLAEEMRQKILQKDSDVGGHVGPNLGVVELTIAFHYVFDSPKDKIVWDVSHQSYGHKLLTGRKNGFEKGHYHEVSGYSNPHESEHDYFTVGHTSTSISLATGLAKARDLKKESGNVVAFIGDGSLSGGLAFEGLNNGGALQTNLIVLVNDNEMSIDENHGSLYQNLAELRQTHGERSNNLFKAMGFDYRYVDNGNDLETVIRLFEEVKDIDHPIVLHVHTEKGRGYQPAIDNKMKYHWHVPFDLSTGEAKQAASGETFNTIIMDYLDKKVQTSTAPIAAVNAAIPGAFGLKTFQEKHPDHYFDVGIAEQHSITFASALASQGVRPVVFQSSTFLQRAYDQLSHDLAINENPVIILVGGGTISASDRTHQGTFDIPYLSSIPNIKYLAPATKEDMISMLDWAFEQTEQPVAIRIPTHGVEHGKAIANDYSIPAYQTVNKGEKVAILALGGFLGLGKETVEAFREKGMEATLINPGTITENDVETLDKLKEVHELVITLEDGSLSGGFGEKISRYYGDSSMHVLNFGAKKEFTDSVPTVKLYERYHLTPSQIVEDSLRVLNIQ
ncbi:TPA: 1-deoxy-D-xylulose-5-phosphate synthase [Enterococcus faecium]|uniref:1-deoxy-D-xylulose-5-phosphate synthase n=1 Tax=Enterococcus faecium TaxID=1352 RepID=A0AB74CTH5_ENTFC|nr:MULTISPECIES: 1-deoxy-D-xylulose-5-phosphate synthase [Enterococcus]EGP4987751.1 1-deoxy-D-xylulose-5-phosphate synthase [Enterococcus faecium]EME7080800.1 1-deoxy-D-xylulose-5-phosphate synthase [Enterococcus faecium]EME7142477.1 1-deoxy-D-xylulose-5-phosphate synthase [Enterococcus faecium]EME8160341.1 1-deoxy-D-xylulose-5-phosphate synthase [Enterococcus faecium]EMF0335969.1 1-deoxy-D-xylulose-5-phosphate synthase [Enterococcus faecium]